MTNEPARTAAPLTSLRTEVRAEHHLFHLRDTAAPPSGDPGDEPPPPGPDRLATTQAGTVTFNSALPDHYPLVTLERWSSPPPPPPDPWPHHTRLTVEFEAGRLAFTSGVSNLPADGTMHIPPGPYTLAVHRTDPEPTDEPVPHHAEQWLLHLWPQHDNHTHARASERG